jgi:hypothetical protein
MKTRMVLLFIPMFPDMKIAKDGGAVCLHREPFREAAAGGEKPERHWKGL